MLRLRAVTRVVHSTTQQAEVSSHSQPSSSGLRHPSSGRSLRRQRPGPLALCCVWPCRCMPATPCRSWMAAGASQAQEHMGKSLGVSRVPALAAISQHAGTHWSRTWPTCGALSWPGQNRVGALTELPTCVAQQRGPELQHGSSSTMPWQCSV
jgi:hypothetical protein